jgi:hypothetical protein
MRLYDNQIRAFLQRLPDGLRRFYSAGGCDFIFSEDNAVPILFLPATATGLLRISGLCRHSTEA